MNDGYHRPVLLDPAIELLMTTTRGVYVDGTIGGGGHAEALLRRLDPEGVVIGFDADADAIRHCEIRLKDFDKRIILVHDNVANLRAHLDRLEIEGIDGILLDLGVSSFQLDVPGRGFSFQRDTALDMRMNAAQSLTAYELINTLDEAGLASMIFEYGEERFARKIAKRIVRARGNAPLRTTGELAEIVKQAVGQRFLPKSLARVFQALRIAVNDELNNLRRALDGVLALLKPEGRIVVISYHSLEDRIVKEFFRREAARSIASGSKLAPDVQRTPRLRVLTRKPVVPGEEEIKSNPRARSAKLRAAARV